VKEKRAAFQAEVQTVAPGRLIYLDEAAATTTMTRRCGRAPAGQRVIAAVPQGHWCVTTMIAAIGLVGVVSSLVFEGATDTEAFATYVEQLLVPQLRPGDVVVMDNLSSHKSARVQMALERVGARLLYLPPYSPDFNPIEKMWSKVKGFLRSAAERTVEGLWDAIGRALNHVSAEDCRGFFGSCGIPLAATPS
jgi:transposase